MRLEAETKVERAPADVFAYLADAERLPEYVEDFAWVRKQSEGEPVRGTAYLYKMKRGAEGSFEWTEFSPNTKLAWHGPPSKAGPGTMEPAGWWELTPEGSGTQVKFVMTPKPGGVFKLMAPLMAIGMRRGNAKALARLKERLEASATGSAAPPGT